jgi:hypothetical protein
VGYAAEIEDLLATIAGLDRLVLVELAERGRGLDAPPTFRGRCLDAAYLDAVASGGWSLDDEAALARYEDRLDTIALSKVRRLDRRGLRIVLRGAVLAVMTRGLPLPQWQERCAVLAAGWVGVAGALPRPQAAVEG